MKNFYSNSKFLIWKENNLMEKHMAVLAEPFG